MTLPQKLFHLFILGGLGLCPLRAFAANDAVIVVLSSNSGPYQHAFIGLKEAFGQSVPSWVVSEGELRIPPNTRVIVAVGGKAAVYPSYPPNSFLIYCLSPGIRLAVGEHPGGILEIQTSPSVYSTLSKFKELQPSLKRLVVLWSSEAIKVYFDQKKEIADRLGVELISDRVRNSDDLPDHLRALKGKVDALWLPSDAAMITPKNFATIKEFSLGNGIPFYVPSEGLVEQGATASVSASFEELGALAAQMAHQALKGPLNTDRVFPEKYHVAVNLTSAKRGPGDFRFAHSDIPAKGAGDHLCRYQ